MNSDLKCKFDLIVKTSNRIKNVIPRQALRASPSLPTPEVQV